MTIVDLLAVRIAADPRTQKELAAASGVSQPVISGISRSEANPDKIPAITVRRLARALKVPTKEWIATLDKGS